MFHDSICISILITKDILHEGGYGIAIRQSTDHLRLIRISTLMVISELPSLFYSAIVYLAEYDINKTGTYLDCLI